MAEDLLLVHINMIIMNNDQTEKNKEKQGNKNATVKPDAETLNTTDPQEHMKGPLSSLMQNTGNSFEKEETEEEVKKKKENK